MFREASSTVPPSAQRLRGGLLPALLLAALLCLAPVRARAQNYLHTSGTKIVDSKGNVVRLTGLNWFGMETSNYCPHGLWVRSMGSLLDQIKGLGYNCLRVPYCNQLFDAGSTPNGIDFNQNPDLQGLDWPPDHGQAGGRVPGARPEDHIGQASPRFGQPVRPVVYERLLRASAGSMTGRCWPPATRATTP